MSNAIFSFLDRSAGQLAADRVIDAGLPPSAVVVHVRQETPVDAHTGIVDELVTGGLISNLDHLFAGVFAERAPADETGNSSDTIGLGESVVSVNARSDAEQTTVDRVMQTAGYARRTSWGADASA